jgi:co-chaperonin GroES (HSP10)
MEKDKFDQLLQEVKKGGNPSGMDPVEYRIVVLNDFIPSKVGMIEKPQNVIEADRWAQTKGYVVAVSDMAFTGENRKPWSCSVPKVGDRVLFAKYAGQLVEDTPYRLISDKDVLAVIEEAK